MPPFEGGKGSGRQATKPQTAYAAENKSARGKRLLVLIYFRAAYSAVQLPF